MGVIYNKTPNNNLYVVSEDLWWDYLHEDSDAVAIVNMLIERTDNLYG